MVLFEYTGIFSWLCQSLVQLEKIIGAKRNSVPATILTVCAYKNFDHQIYGFPRSIWHVLNCLVHAAKFKFLPVLESLPKRKYTRFEADAM